MRLEASIDGIGLIGPGLRSWAEGRAILTGAAPYVAAATELPAPAALPSSERRRASRATRLVLAAGLEAVAGAAIDPSAVATVFASSGGDGYNCHEICQQLATSDRQLSPTRFHNSVHNAPAGYWGIASGSMAPSSVISAHDASFAAGLLEALSYVVTSGERCLLVAYDTDYPEPLRATRPTPDAFAIALVLSPAGSASSLATLAAAIGGAAPEGDDRHPDSDPIESMRASIAAARGLPLIEAIARGIDGRLCIDYLDDSPLVVDLTVAPR